jgi:hypothetical protein
MAATIIIPAYAHPSAHPDAHTTGTGMWTTIATTAPPAGFGYVICDISGTGPGTSVDTDYVRAVAAARDIGWTVIGYVDTDYTARTPATVMTEMDNWASLYGITGIFFDRAANQPVHLDYYAHLTAYARDAHEADFVCLNMGDAPDPGYLSSTVCDAVIVFEANRSVFESTPPLAYFDVPVGIGHIVESTATVSTMASQLAASLALGADLIYITDETADLYNVLPTYFDAEVAAISG